MCGGATKTSGVDDGIAIAVVGMVTLRQLRKRCTDAKRNWDMALWAATPLELRNTYSSTLVEYFPRLQ